MAAIPTYNSNIVILIPVFRFLDFFFLASVFRCAHRCVPVSSRSVQLHSENVMYIEEIVLSCCRRDKQESAKAKQPETTMRTGVRNRRRKRKRLRRVGRG